MAWSSKAPATLDALYVGVAAAIPDANVFKMIAVSGSSKPDSVVIGYSTDDTPAIVHDNRLTGAVVAMTRDKFSITCVITAVDGGGDLVKALERAYVLLSQVAQVLVDDHELGDTVMTSCIGEISARPSQSKGGAVVTLLFAVDCDSFSNA